MLTEFASEEELQGKSNTLAVQASSAVCFVHARSVMTWLLSLRWLLIGDASEVRNATP
jgi:hypothetical protein